MTAKKKLPKRKRPTRKARAPKLSAKRNWFITWDGVRAIGSFVEARNLTAKEFETLGRLVLVPETGLAHTPKVWGQVPAMVLKGLEARGLVISKSFHA